MVAAVGIAMAESKAPDNPNAITTNPLGDASQLRDVATCYPMSSTRWTGSTDGTTITDDSEVRGYDTEDGWMQFDVSGVPDGAFVTRVDLYIYVNSTYYPYWSGTPMSVDPVTATPADIYNDINAEANDGYYIYANESSSYAPGWHSYQLGGDAVPDMQAALAGDKFGVGIVSRDNSTTYYIICDGWNEANPPYLEVTYSDEPPPVYYCDATMNMCGPYYGTGAAWNGDMAYNPNTGTMYQVEVGGANGIYEWDPVTCEMVNYCTTVPWAISQRGIAYDPGENVCYVGGWNDGIVYKVTPPPDCALLGSCYAPYYAIAGLAFDPDMGKLWCITNSSPDQLYSMDPNTCALIDGPFNVAWSCPTDGYSSGGLAYRPDGNFITVNMDGAPASALEKIDQTGASLGCCGLTPPNTFGWGVGYPYGARDDVVWVSCIDDFMNYEHLAVTQLCDGPTDLTCELVDGCAHLEWVNNDTYTEIMVYRGSDLVATLPGCDVSFDDCDLVGPASYTYFVQSMIDDELCSPSNTCDILYAQILYLFDFNESDGGFTHMCFDVTGCPDGIDDWQWGMPSYEVFPGDETCDGVELTNCWGTNLIGDYQYTHSCSKLMSQPLFFDDVALMEVCHYYSTESSFDGGNVKVSVDGGATWTLIYPQAGYDGIISVSTAYYACHVDNQDGYMGASDGWKKDFFDLTPFMGMDVIVAFDFGSDESVQYPGWYIKWVKVYGPPEVDVAEGLTPSRGAFSLADATPNPFTGMTEISFSLPVRTEADLKVFDASGRLVRNLSNNVLDAGTHVMTWDGRDEAGRAVNAGIYFYKLSTADNQAVKKVVLMR
jgi:hypothetical protein